jgi:threonine dehydratase
MPKVTLKCVQDAREAIAPFVKATPLVRSAFLSDLCGGDVFLKLENQQVTGSFKPRGVFNKLLHLTDDERARGVVTASAGNHGQAVAYAAKQLGFQATIVLPTGMPHVKVEGIKKYGAKVVVCGSFFDEAEQKAKELAKSNERIFISAYNDELVVAGHGTVGLEIVETLPGVQTIIVPVGGGGLIAGVAAAAKAVKPTLRVLGVQSEASPVMHDSLRAGKIVDLQNPHAQTIAEGLFGGLEKDAITFEIVKDCVDDVMVVKEESIRHAVRLLWDKDQQVVEGSGASSVALMLENKGLVKGQTVVALVTGGNIDDSLFRSIATQES